MRSTSCSTSHFELQKPTIIIEHPRTIPEKENMQMILKKLRLEISKCLDQCDTVIVKEMSRATSQPESADAQNKPLQDFLEDRSLILTDIKDFLYIALQCLDTCLVEDLDTIGLHVSRLVKSLCLVHALYGYPVATYTEEQVTSIDKNAVKKLVTEQDKIENKNLLDYCKELEDDNFWEIGETSLESLPREPAYVFLEMVKNLFCDHKKPSVIGRRWLRQLESKNGLKPEVWAQHRSKKESSGYGVSLGVRSFVRPLYLYTKLCQLRNSENSPLVSLKDVIAFTIEDDNVKQPCITCQCTFGFTRFPIIGNCAEYDVIGTVHPHLLQTEHWKEQWKEKWKVFESACQQHLAAFNNFNAMKLDINEYFENTRHPKKPKVLKYQWNAAVTGGFEIIAVDN